MLADRAAPVGGHLAHLIVLAIWLAVVAGVLLVDHLRGNRWRDSEATDIHQVRTDLDPAITASPVRISMATWPPRDPRAVEPARRTPTPYPVPRDVWVAMAVVGSLVAAVVHLIVMPEHFEESSLYGGFFAVIATVQISYAGCLARRPTTTLLRAGLAGNAAVIALWAYTRLVEVPLGPGRGGTEAVGALDVIATTAEVLVVLGCLGVLLRVRPSPPESTATRRHPAGAAAAR